MAEQSSAEAALFASPTSLLSACNCLGAEPEQPRTQSVNVSDTILRQLATDRKKTDWPGGTGESWWTRRLTMFT